MFHFSGVSSSINNVKNLVNSNSLFRKLTLIILRSFTLDAHIVIVFLLIPINYTFALFLLSYFLILTSYLLSSYLCCHVPLNINNNLNKIVSYNQFLNYFVSFVSFSYFLSVSDIYSHIYIQFELSFSP